ncbi:MAG: hypothetical protein IIC71_14750 [Acidobacteria bacterium]|nr:hypothetical protein [Acidobacteriota bacterium]
MRSWLRFALLPALALVVVACASSDDPSSASAVPTNVSAPDRTGGGLVTAPGEDVIRLSPAETAAALTDAATAESGVWSVLANLGIGVYTGSGQRVLGGSETSEDDFWLYDFEVPALVRMATAPPRPFAITHSRVDELGFDGTIDDLLRFYHDTYAAVPEAYLVQLFEAAGIVFEGDLELTPLEEWLVMLDTFVPPNGTSESQAASAGLMPAIGVTALAERPPTAAGRSKAPRAVYQSCGTISYGVVHSIWGEAWRSSPLAVSVIEAYYAIHGLMLVSGVEATIEAVPGTAHEGHGAEGEPVDFVVTVNLEYFSQDVYVPDCGLLVNLGQPVHGPLRGVRIAWDSGEVLDDHGWFREGYPESFTDLAGEARLTYVPREERDGGKGSEREVFGFVGARFNMRNALMAFVTEPRILMLVPEWMPITQQAMLEIKWHQVDSTWSLAMTLDMMTDPGEVIRFLWDGVFTVDADGEVDGEGIGTILGSGKCVENDVTLEVIEVTGTFTFEVTGTRTLRDGAEWLTLRVDATEADVQWRAQVPRCVAFAESFPTAFFSAVPTFPAQWYPQGFDIQVADGVGFADLTMDPMFVLEVDVTQLSE